MWKNTGSRRPDFAETPKEGQESVWDYPRPPRLQPDTRSVVVRVGDEELACSHQNFRLCETASPPTFYLPPTAVNWTMLVPAAGSSVCEWKGEATYWALATAPDVALAWAYPEPRSRYAKLANHVAFYPALVECYVDDERVVPQPGRFYGGWVTSDVVGPFKGAAGTGHW